MPVNRQRLASTGAIHLDRVGARPAGRDWGAAHQAEGWRCILPGHGQVQLRRAGSEQVFVDALTAFRLSAGEAYQLRHESEREHPVLHGDQHPPLQLPGRAWLLRPRELFELKRTLAQLRRGELDLPQAVRGAQLAMGRASMLQLPAGSRVEQARHCLASRAFGPLRMEEVAEQVRGSPFHLTRQFRQQLGVTPHQYLLHLRLAGALQRLEQRDEDLAGIAHDVGFSSQSHFGDVFRRAIGCTPGQAREALR